MKKIFITGGHFAPAKAVIDLLSGWEIYYVGRKYSMEDDRALALEYQELSHLNYLVITTGRLQRKFFTNLGQSIRALLKTPVGLLQAFWWLIRYRPNVVLSFGGYVALPVVIAAWLLNIPIITHEQTQTMGLANRIIALFAKKVMQGSILRKEVIEAKVAETNTIFITGGNQGAHVINLAVEKVVESLAKKFRVVHQMGSSSFNDFERARKIKNYFPVKFLTGDQQASAMASAKIIISRAGANTLAEIAYFGKPSILIPIPWSSAAEQEKNAKVLADLKMAEVIPQDKLSGKTLLSTIEKISKNYDQYLENAKESKTLVDPHAAEKIVEEINVILEAEGR
jgi:UDP-N-acetylglucosamine--N-acetylmuramyl-(pentapeptide) pyrophosphoryl-undecaprenol N-acetylglucosamine transferase